jgi:lipopolysaccharide biosynthesis glycosyltransferase
MEEYNIVFCSDSNIIEYFPTVLNSIYQHNKDHKFIIHYIHNITDNTIIERLELIVKRHFPNMNLKTYFAQWEHGYKGYGHITSATMLRLFIPDLLKDVKKVLYLDIDIIVCADLKKLLDLEVGECGVCLYREPVLFRDKDSLCKKYNITNNQVDKYICNAGVMLWDLDILREKKFTETCLKYNSIEPKDDQTLINLYCNGKQAYLDNIYNLNANRRDLKLNEKPEYILHYLTGNKPWKNPRHHYYYIWDQYRIHDIIVKQEINWRIYRELNPDLVFRRIITKEQCLEHWEKYGKKENRKHTVQQLTPDFDWKKYKELNRDLRFATQTDYEVHWIRLGIRERRKYK